jgi:hypothetical protein
MLNVFYAECRNYVYYAECHYAERHYAECHYTECRCALWTFYKEEHFQFVNINLSFRCFESVISLSKVIWKLERLSLASL